MAKQIIVTKDNYGIEIIATLVNQNKESVDVTGQIVEVVIVDDNDTIVDKVEAQHIDSSRGIVSITLQKEHTSTIGLYKTYWSALDKDNNVTAQEDIYYYCKDKNGGASNDSYVQEEKFDNESIINKFKETDAEIEGIKQDLSHLHKVNVNAEVVDARGEYGSLGERLNVVDNDLTGVHLEMESINASLDNMTNKNPLYAFDFGAKGDGITNDTLALQNAINRAISKKEKLILNKGTYLVSQLVINDSIFIDGNNVVIKSINNNTSSSIIQLLNKGVKNSIIKNINIDGNIENNTNVIHGIELTSDVYHDTFSLLDNIEIYSCTGNGLHITGSYQKSSIRELKISNVNAHNCNGNGLYANSFTDSFIYNCVFHSNGQNGVLLDTTGSIKITNIKCYFNGRKGTGRIEDSRIPHGVSESDKDKYEYKLNGIKLYKCTLTMITSAEIQDNAGDGIYAISCTQTQLINVTCDNNGLLIGDDFSTESYESRGIEPYFYGIYMKHGGFSNIIANFNNHFYDTHGYTQKSSLFLSSVNNNNIIATVRLQPIPIVYENIDYDKNSILINGNHIKMDVDLSVLTIADGYTLINNNWNGSYMYVKNNKLYFKLAIRKDDYFPTTPVNLVTLPAGLRPKTYTRSTIAFMSKNYADDNDGGLVHSYFDPNGILHITQKSENMKIANIQGEIDII